MGAWLWIAECEALGEAEVKGFALLCDSERARHRRIRNRLRRRQFLLGRLMLREMLSRRFGEAIENWPLAEQPGQAPRLMRPLPSPAAFSIAHSHHRVACLVAMGHRAGCDIEFMGKIRDIQCITAFMFGAEAALALTNKDKNTQQEFFHRAWTRHEAALKYGENSPALLTTVLDGDYCLSVALEQTQGITTHRIHWTSGQVVASSQELAWEFLTTQSPFVPNPAQ